MASYVVVDEVFVAVIHRRLRSLCETLRDSDECDRKNEGIEKNKMVGNARCSRRQVKEYVRHYWKHSYKSHL